MSGASGVRCATVASIKFLQPGFEELNKRNYEFYEFIESNYYDLEERLTILERKVKDLS